MLLIICCFFQSLFSQPQRATAIEDTTFYDRVRPKLVRLVNTIENVYQFTNDMMGEQVTPYEHALQAADMARIAMPEQDNLVIAALLHDIGWVLYPESKNPAQESYNFLKPIWGDAVAHPILNLIKAKRFLVAVDAGYSVHLTEASQRRLKEQGGAYSQDSAEYIAFKKDPYFEESIALRIWDDRAKSTTCITRSFADYQELLVEHSYAHLRKCYKDEQIEEAIALIRDVNTSLKSRL